MKPGTEVIEECLEAIYKARIEERADSRSVAARLGWPLDKTEGLLGELSSIGLTTVTGRDVTLTDKGEAAALAVVRKHRLSERFLTDVLGLPWEKVHDEACRFEHIVSDDVEDGLERLLDNPDTCPHGHPIPAKDGAILEEPSTPLADCGASDQVKIVKVFEDDPEMLKYLATLGLLPNVDLKIEEVGPFNGPLLISVGAAQYALGRDVAAQIMVRII